MGIQDKQLILPKQLNKIFFKKAIEKGLNLKGLEICEIFFSAGSNDGDNYCSEIFRALVEYKENEIKKNISLIVKYIPTTGDRKLIREMRFCEREQEVYFKIIPEMQKLLGEDVILAPKCLYAVDEPDQIMVFEDLRELGCIMADRITGLDENRCKMVLEKIGKYHAASMVIAKKNPNAMKNFNITIFHDDTEKEVRDSICLGNLKYMQEYLSMWPNYETIVEKLKKVEKHFYEKGLKSVTLQKNGIAVLNHGDLWTNNMMFRHIGNKPIDVIFLDLQIAYYGSLGMDINYFLNSSVPIKLLKTKRYELLRIYYASLKNTLKQLKHSTIPTWDQVRNEIKYTEFYGFFTFEYLLPMLLIDRSASKDNSFESFSNEKKMEKNREIAFKTERMIETLKYSLDRFDELGVFD